MMKLHLLACLTLINATKRLADSLEEPQPPLKMSKIDLLSDPNVDNFLHRYTSTYHHPDPRDLLLSAVDLGYAAILQRMLQSTTFSDGLDSVVVRKAIAESTNDVLYAIISHFKGIQDIPGWLDEDLLAFAIISGRPNATLLLELIPATIEHVKQALSVPQIESHFFDSYIQKNGLLTQSEALELSGCIDYLQKRPQLETFYRIWSNTLVSEGTGFESRIWPFMFYNSLFLSIVGDDVDDVIEHLKATQKESQWWGVLLIALNLDKADLLVRIIEVLPDDLKAIGPEFNTVFKTAIIKGRWKVVKDCLAKQADDSAHGFLVKQSIHQISDDYITSADLLGLSHFNLLLANLNTDLKPSKWTIIVEQLLLAAQSGNFKRILVFMETHPNCLRLIEAAWTILFINDSFIPFITESLDNTVII